MKINKCKQIPHIALGLSGVLKARAAHQAVFRSFGFA